MLTLALGKKGQYLKEINYFTFINRLTLPIPMTEPKCCIPLDIILFTLLYYSQIMLIYNF